VAFLATGSKLAVATSEVGANFRIGRTGMKWRSLV
jgi:hypothetical protein